MCEVEVEIHGDDRHCRCGSKRNTLISEHIVIFWCPQCGSLDTVPGETPVIDCSIDIASDAVYISGGHRN